ncbi:MAG: hypothetical protein IJV00_05275 [Clostridia bacterium]|nr:hypothetical protein [Clostridia bacterium]
MKFPKMKHPWLCQTLLYLPGLLMFIWLFILIFFDPVSSALPSIQQIAILLALGVFSVWYLFHNYLLFLIADARFYEIHSWQRDRLEYRSNINGLDKDIALSRIIRRCKLLRWKIKDVPDGEFTVCFKHAYSVTKFYSSIEKRIAVCKTGRLTVKNYTLLLGRARALLERMPDGDPPFKSIEVRISPRAHANLIVILADNVDEDVKTKARDLPVNKDERCVLPCVAECTTGSYYMNGRSKDFFVGVTGRPAQNYARSMARRLVFGHGLPRADREKLPPFEKMDILEKSLWEFIRETKKGLKTKMSAEEAESVRMLKRMKNCQIRIGEHAVYCKTNDRLAAWGFIRDSENDKAIGLSPGGVWYYRKDSLKGVPGFADDFSKRKMTPRQIAEVDEAIRRALTDAGYTIKDEKEE